ncbi:MAG: RNA polymerase sigma factor [Actinomycetota bacterium]|nr:RNA polymerase sigma factor [Actinomycetota bacterium]
MRAGDAAAFTSLYERYYDDVLRYARRRVDEQTARDVAAETFLVAWRRPGQVPGEEPLPWLYAVARNTLANVLRGRSRDAALGVRVRAASVAAGVPTADPADVVVQSVEVAAALGRLSRPDQEALQLVAWEDLDLAAAAQVVGCSAATFAVRLHRARRRLGRLLAAPSPEADSTYRVFETEAT